MTEHLDEANLQKKSRKGGSEDEGGREEFEGEPCLLPRAHRGQQSIAHTPFSARPVYEKRDRRQPKLIPSSQKASRSSRSRIEQ